jgi:hypothetical protein
MRGKTHKSQPPQNSIIRPAFLSVHTFELYIVKEPGALGRIPSPSRKDPQGVELG